MIAGPIAYPLMQISQWYTAYAGLFFMIFTLAGTMCLPETLYYKGSSQANNVDQPPEALSTFTTTYRRTIKLWRDTSSVMKSLLFRDKQLGLLLLSLMFTTIGTYSQFMLLQYISKRYGVSWAEVSQDCSLKAGRRRMGKLTALLGQPFGVSQTNRNTCCLFVDHAFRQSSDRQGRSICGNQGSLYRTIQSLFRHYFRRGFCLLAEHPDTVFFPALLCTQQSL